jgi:hypothetical protein
VDYSKALIELDPILRRRLRAVARIADMSELDALQTIVESSQDLVDNHGPSASTEDPR